MEKLSQTWSLMRASWDVLRKDRELLVFPLLSGISCALVIAAFAFPLARQYSGSRDMPDQLTLEQIVMAFAFYFSTYFVMSFFNTGIIAAALIRIRGGDPTVRDGFKAAWSRVVLIAEWALVCASVGTILRVIEGRSNRLGQIVSGLVGTAWSVGTFLVVPILVVEDIDPIGAVRESVRLLKKTWGQQLVGSFSFGLASFILGIPGILVMLMGGLAMADSFAAGMALVVLGVIYVVALGLVQSALQSVFQASVYAYAREGTTAAGFDRDLLAGSFGR
ncbi:MAG: DUF6159 family protein [Candidatus Eisenbacteria bacterium]|jgi:hypothetical protein|nr:DUF6159 family protein [Candidatus Eisenbacteria bacterium]